MIVNYDLKSDDFGKDKRIKEKARVGVSIKIEKR
jgi:hypothetical protein